MYVGCTAGPVVRTSQLAAYSALPRVTSHGHLVVATTRCPCTSSCQSTATSEIVKRFRTRAGLLQVVLYQVLFTLTYIPEAACVFCLQ